MAQDPFDLKCSSIMNFFQHEKLLLREAEIAVRSGQVVSCQLNSDAKMLYGIVNAANAHYKVEIKLSDKSTIESVTCECRSTTLCYHIAAIALQSTFEIPTHSLRIKEEVLDFDDFNSGNLIEPVQSIEGIYLKQEFDDGEIERYEKTVDHEHPNGQTDVKIERFEMTVDPEHPNEQADVKIERFETTVDHESSKSSMYYEDTGPNVECDEEYKTFLRASEIKIEETSAQGTLESLNHATEKRDHCLMRLRPVERQNYQEPKIEKTPQQSARRKLQRKKCEREHYREKLASLTAEQMAECNKREQKPHQTKRLFKTQAKRERKRYQRVSLVFPQQLAKPKQPYLKRNVLPATTTQKQSENEIKESPIRDKSDEQINNSFNLQLEDNRPTKVNMFYCALCPTRFLVKSGLRKHQIRKHNMWMFLRKKTDDVLCNQMNTDSDMKRSVSGEIWESEKSHKYQCNVCSEMFVESSGLEIHWKEMHDISDSKVFQNEVIDGKDTEMCYTNENIGETK